MRLRELNPTIEPVKVATTQHPVIMVPTGDWRLSFWCPTCGKPYSVSILIGESRQEAPRRWQADPMPELFTAHFGICYAQDPDQWFDRVTITPSINNVGARHGRKHPTCGFHGNISNGNIL